MEYLRLAQRAQDMTYVKQLKDYENAVMAKRLEEMPETEKERLAAEGACERAAAEERMQRVLEIHGSVDKPHGVVICCRGGRSLCCRWRIKAACARGLWLYMHININDLCHGTAMRAFSGHE